MAFFWGLSFAIVLPCQVIIILGRKALLALGMFDGHGMSWLQMVKRDYVNLILVYTNIPSPN